MNEIVEESTGDLRKELKEGIDETREQVQRLLFLLGDVESLRDEELSEGKFGELLEAISEVSVGVTGCNREIRRVEKDVFGLERTDEEEIAAMLQSQFDEARGVITDGHHFRLPSVILKGLGEHPGVLQLVKEGLSLKDALLQVLDTIYEGHNSNRIPVRILRAMADKLN